MVIGIRGYPEAGGGFLCAIKTESERDNNTTPVLGSINHTFLKSYLSPGFRVHYSSSTPGEFVFCNHSARLLFCSSDMAMLNPQQSCLS